MIRPVLVVGVPIFGIGLLGACLDPTQATLVVTTNVACGATDQQDGTLFETGLNAAATSEAAKRGLATTTRACKPTSDISADVGSMVIFPEGGASGATAVVVGALNSTSAEECFAVARKEPRPDEIVQSCIVATRTVAFVDHAMLEIPVLLDKFCAGVICPGNTTCVHAGDTKTVCIDDEVTCRNADCDIGEGGGIPVGGGGEGGSGGRGGGGGGGGGTVVAFELLPYDDLPLAIGAAAHGVSGDGNVVVGRIEFVGDIYSPAVWRPEGRFVLDSAGFLNGIAWAANADGSVVVGEIGNHAAKWVWNNPDGYDLPVDLGNESSARDVDDDGNVIVGHTNMLTVFWIGDVPESPSASGAIAHAVDGAGELAGGMGPSLDAYLWSTMDAAAFPVATGRNVLGLSHDGSMGVGQLADMSGFHVDIDLQGPGAVVVHPLGSAMMLEPRKVARVGPAWRAVGGCVLDGLYNACVWDGTTSWSTIGDSAQPWELSAGVVLMGTAPQIATDISTSGRVIVGWAAQNMTTVAWKLTVPPL